jgi:hypothetical protein
MLIARAMWINFMGAATKSEAIKARTDLSGLTGQLEKTADAVSANDP